VATSPGRDIVADSLDVIAVAPHPDDLEILCGGTLAKLVKQGYKVGMVDLTCGEPTPRGTLETRKKEAEAARQILGVPVRINLDLPNRILMDGPEARYALATVFRKYRPSLVMAAIFVRVIASWFGISPYRAWMRPVVALTDWIVEPIRRLLPPMGMIDFSPMVAWLVLWVARGLILGVL
jgi:uncharacterized protein YggT (Ycf19 family)